MSISKQGLLKWMMALVILAGFWLIWQRNKVDEIRYSLPERSTWWIAPSILAEKWGMFEDERIAIKSRHWATGRSAMEAMLQEHGDIAFVAGPPVLLASTVKENEMLVLAQAMVSRKILHMLRHNAHEQTWLEQPIGLARRTISEFYLVAHLRKIGALDLYRSGKLQLIDREVSEAVFASLLDGSTKTIVLYEPFASLIKMGEPGQRSYTEVTDPSAYEVKCYIVTTRKSWARQREPILRAIAAIKRASDTIKRDPEKAFRDAIPLMEYPEHAERWGQRDWPSVDFDLVTDKAILRKGFAVDAEIAKIAGLVKGEIDLDALLAVTGEVDRYLRGRGL